MVKGSVVSRLAGFLGEAIGIPGLELLDISPGHFLEAHTVYGAKAGEVPKDISELERHGLELKGVSVEEDLLHKVDELAGFSGEPHRHISCGVCRAPVLLKGSAGELLILLKGKGLLACRGRQSG